MGNILDSNTTKDQSVLKKSMGGGPMGLGDPNDKSLRVLEKDVIISKMIRDRVRQEHCKEAADALENCGGEATFLLTVKCGKERDELMHCSEFWFKSEELRKECTEEYLKQRSYFRRTGKRGFLYKEDDLSLSS